jgi:protein phosphatase
MNQPTVPTALTLPWLEGYAASNIGKKRSYNQDRFLFAHWSDQEAVLAVVADGMGGTQAGDVAAQIAIETFAQLLETPFPTRDQDGYNLLQKKFDEADRAIRKQASQSFYQLGMGTTLVVAVFTPKQYLHLYAGDSRLYQFRNGKLLYKTADHSIVRLLLDLGKITPEQVPYHPMRSQLTSCLGGKEGKGHFSIDPKWDDEQPPIYPWHSGDVILLCSDGLHGLVLDERISSRVEECGKDAEKLTNLLIEEALEAGGSDNITVLTACMP